ncbi:hypothetical protein FRC09_008703 [Ceratobasidium sp. 395]|nr:hypothetical protein FRC09_008703 [Ceratobasidium sp. 395]
MADDNFPIDPLLERALAQADNTTSTPQTNEESDHGGWGDTEMNNGTDRNDCEEHSGGEGASTSNKRPRIDNDNAGASGGSGLLPPSVAASSSRRQYVQSIVELKKLGTNSKAELHRFATASEPEREVMGFAVELEVRDALAAVSGAVVSSGTHSELTSNIKKYTAAAFFAPDLSYYSPPRSGKRSKDLSGAVYEALRITGVSHLPPSGDIAARDKILTDIGKQLTSLRSEVKSEIAKRTPGEPGMDIGSFTSRVTRNTSIKVTKAHYGRMAFLCRAFRSWGKRPDLQDNKKYWDWVDEALAEVRIKTKDNDKALQIYFLGMLEEDEAKFSKGVEPTSKARDREDWQKKVEDAAKGLQAAK